MENIDKIINIRVKYSDLIKGMSESAKRIDTLNDRISELKSGLKGLKAARKAGTIDEEAYNEQVAQTTQELVANREEVKALQSAMRLFSREIQDNIKEEKNLEGSVNGLRKSIRDLTAQYNALSAADREGSVGNGIAERISKMQAQVSAAEQRLGNFRSNVGNYQSAFNGLNVSVSQIVRELPSATMGANMFFLAISNNIPMLVDEINKLRAANKLAMKEGKQGVFELAHKGTLFLDEIGDMPLALQAKILRCIQEKAIEPVGSNTTQKVDVRIIAATNQNLVEAIEKGKFRRDLYYRLNVYPIIMPSLRERKEDIPLLAEHFALRAAGEMGKVPVTFTEAALEILKNHTWPGNIRELENCIERLTIIASGTAITPERLASCAVPGGGDASRPSAPGSAFPLDLDRQLAETERDLILRVLEETGGVQVKAAELLNISERSMWHRIKKLGINIINKKEMI